MGPNEEHVREQMERDADMMRGLGQMPSLADMRYYDRALNEAALIDSSRMPCGHSNPYGEGACPVCGYEPEWVKQEREMYATLNAEINAWYDSVELGEQVAAWEDEGGALWTR